MGESKHELPFLSLQPGGCGGDALWIVSGCMFTCRVKYRKEILKLVDRVGSNGNIQD